FQIPELNRVFAELLGTTKGIANQYRSNGLAPNGPSSLAEIDKWLKNTGSKLKENDRLMIYFTGHGGKGDKKTPQNTYAYLWNNEKLKMTEFTKRLDKLPIDAPVVLVMVQCYSGGFVNLIFKDGDPKKGMAKHPRAGFFATVHNRVAAGCTPDIREENYQEYSTNFWEALCGKTRLGATIEKPDFDGDGKISYAEAHAHVILTSNTIDVPVKTSDAFLRQYSRTQPTKGKDDTKEAASGTFLKSEDDYAKILEQASSVERAVLEGLSKKLGLDADNRAKEARDLMNDLESQRKKLAEQKKKPVGERKRIKGKLATEIRKRWPEVGNPYHPNARALFEPDQSKQVLAVLRKGGEWPKYLKAKKEISKLDKQRFELDRRKVKCMRFLRALENVALETNLELVADEKIIARYKKLRELENGTLRMSEPGT
ncbi:MAG: C13 family peptidase, partial [Opitutales bacterium]